MNSFFQQANKGDVIVEKLNKKFSPYTIDSLSDTSIYFLENENIKYYKYEKIGLQTDYIEVKKGKRQQLLEMSQIPVNFIN